MHSCLQHRKAELPAIHRVAQLFPLFLLLMLLASSFIACASSKASVGQSCAGAPQSTAETDLSAFFTGCCPSTDAPTATPQSAVVPVQRQDAHQPERTIAAWFDVTGSVGAAYPEKGKQLIATNLDALVAPGLGTQTLYTAAVTHDSYSVAAMLGTFTIQPIAADPEIPTLEPQPPSTDNPIQDKLDQKKARTANCATLRAYYTTLATAHAALPNIQKQVQQQTTDRLRSLKLPSPKKPGTDLCGVFERTSSWLADAQGEKWFIAITDLLATTKVQCAGGYNFSGWHIRILYDPCGDDDTTAGECLKNNAAWMQLWKQGGAIEVKILDPVASDALGNNLFS